MAPSGFQTMKKARNGCIDAVDCSISPDIGVVAKSHDPQAKGFTLLIFKKRRELVFDPTGLFETFFALMRAGKCIPGVPGKAMQHDNTGL